MIIDPGESDESKSKIKEEWGLSDTKTALPMPELKNQDVEGVLNDDLEIHMTRTHKPNRYPYISAERQSRRTSPKKSK